LVVVECPIADSFPPVPVAAVDTRADRAAAIYAAWRNAHLRDMPVEQFNRIEAASKHLVDLIVAAL